MRVLFTEEAKPGNRVILLLEGEMDDSLLEALEHFISRIHKRRRGKNEEEKK